ncbi:MAG: sugar kinase, partial [Acidobacteriaceae bacterium]|nr:sugar kinase [Acidobacteriaceae bacterium]
MRNDAPEIVVAGELFIDLIFSGFDSWPQPSKEIFAKEFRREIGGGAAITACGLARLGSNAAVLGAVGNDAGNWVVEQLRLAGIDTQSIHFDDAEPTALTVAASTPENRAFLTYSGANRGLQPLLFEAMRAKRFVGARHVHLAFAPAIESAEELFRGLRESGCTLSLDVGWREEWLRESTALTILPGVDIFFPNELEARQLTGEDDPEKILQAFRAAGIERVALKLGAQGAAMLWNGEIAFINAHPVTPIDTTGAGDCFDAG